MTPSSTKNMTKSYLEFRVGIIIKLISQYNYVTHNITQLNLTNVAKFSMLDSHPKINLNNKPINK